VKPIPPKQKTESDNKMNERDFMKTVMAFAVIGLGVLGSAVAAADVASVKKPNVIFILADDWGYGDVKCLGGDRCKIETPNMDSLAKAGMVFTDAHTSSSVCTPSRYSILTGRYNWRSGLKKGVLDGDSPRLIEKDRKTVAKYMADNGYQTACIGKWHLGMHFPPGAGKKTEKQKTEKQIAKVDWKGVITDGPTAVGFGYYYGISASLDMPPFIWIHNDRFVGECTTIKVKEFDRSGPGEADFKAVDVLPTLGKKSVEFIQANKDKPFFLYVPLNSPHTPIAPSKEWVGKSKLGNYGDFVMETDWVVGQIVKAVDDAGLAEKTLIIVSSDNGCSPAVNKKGNSKEELLFNGAKKEAVQPDKHYPNGVFRGTKADIFDGGHRVPFIARWPGKVKAGTTCAETVCLVDLFATCAEIVGKKPADSDAPDSVSFLPYLMGTAKGPLREATVHHSIDGAFAIRKGKWKLCLCPGSGGWSAPKPNSPEAKSLSPVQLYDLSTDVGETVNLQDKYPEVVKELTELLKRYVEQGRSTPGVKLENTGGVNLKPTPSKETGHEEA
jgi:arylsulfatase A